MPGLRAQNLAIEPIMLSLKEFGARGSRAPNHHLLFLPRRNDSLLDFH